MKNRFKFLSLIMCLFMIMQVVLPCFDVTYAVISDNNTILIACGVTIKNNTTLNQVVSQYGQQPKITTSSVFGGTATTFYKEGYEDLLYIETNEAGIVMAAGTCATDFKSNLKDYHEPFDGTVHFMQGYVIDDWDDGAIGVLAYNNAVKNGIEQKKLLDKWYSNQYEYEKNLCQHAIPIVNCYLTRDGDSPIEFNNEIYDTLAKIEQNGKDLQTYAEENNKTDTYKRVGSDTGYLATWEAMPNPFRAADGASGFRATETKKYGYFKYHIEPKDSNNYLAEVEKYYVSEDLIKKGGEEVALTQDEQEKLEAAKAMYKKSVEEFNQSGNIDHEIDPVYDKTPLVAGKIYENRLKGAVDYLNAIRVAAGLPTVKYNATLSNAAQHKSVLVVYVNNFAGYTSEELKNMNAHYPPKPDAVSQEFYNTAMSNMSAENLYNGDIISSIPNAINDGYGDPITCGHRYNLLEPYWTDFGLGEAGRQSTHRFSGSQSYTNEIVAWPSDGITPLEAYAGGYWTCKFYKNYQVTDSTTIDVKRLNDNKTWSFSVRTKYGDNRFQVNGNLLSFYNADMTGKEGLVYEFTIHKLRNTQTKTYTDYTYRTVFKSISGTSKKVLKYPESVSLDKNEAVMNVNDKINLKTTFSTDTTEVCVKFESDNEDVASVDQYGNVTAKKLGEATITVTTLNDKKATCKVKVIDGVAVDKTSVTMFIDTNDRINAITTQGEKLTWKSSNQNVVSVDSNGNITAKNTGSATITVTTSKGKSVTIKVNIIKYLKGDLDRNGIVNANDAAVAQDLYNGTSITEEDLQIGDMDENGVLNSNDAALISDIYNSGK